MAEPTSSGAAGFAGWKLLGGLAGISAIGAGLAAIVAMCAMTPRHPREWAIGLISTFVFSIGGGSAVVSYFKLHEWAHDPFGMAGVLGLMFACGLPGWAIVRWWFTYVERHKDQDIAEVVKDLKGLQ